MKTFVFLFALFCFSIFEGGNFEEGICGISTAGDIFDNYFNNKPDVNKIIGGEKMIDGRFPWIVYLTIAHDGDFGGCTGTVISQNYILAAKHCTAFENLDLITIFYGSANQKKMIKQTSTVVFHSLGFDQVGQDIGLIKLQSPIEFNENVNPICLSRTLRPKIGDKAVVAGFGFVFRKVNHDTQEGDEVDEKNMDLETVDDLQAVKVDIIEDKNCTCNCDNPEFIALGIQKENEICAGGLQKGTLQGDSGGPLMILEKTSKKWFQVGVTSRGQTYATNNSAKVVDRGIYTDVAKFCDWIENTTNKEVTCES